MIDRLSLLFRTLGTPNEVNWPGVTDLSNYKSTFPKWKEQDLSKVFPSLPYDAIDLLKVCILHDGNQHLRACLHDPT